jgi:hypothetical protein
MPPDRSRLTSWPCPFVPRTIARMSVNGFERRAAFVGGCITGMAAAGAFFVVRLVSQDGGGYSDFFFALGLLAAIFAVGSFVALLRVARTGTGIGAAVWFSLATGLVLVVMGAAVGLRG